MKQVIFLCLLSLTLCLSKPAEPEAQATPGAVKTVEDVKPETAKDKQALVVPTQTQSTSNQTSLAAPPSNNTVPAHEETTKSNTTTDDNNKTTEKKESPPTTKATEGTPKVETTTKVAPATDGKANNNTKPEEKDPKSKTSTVGPVPSASSEAPKPTETPKPTAPAKDEDKHVVQARGFDGPSFIGGIILSLGLLAIGFMGFKYYKNQTERNYHTL